jgi:hypothetical protein
MMDYRPQQEDLIDLEQLRARLRKMLDAALLHWGRYGRRLCSAEFNRGRPPRQVFAIQLEEARAERRRRKDGVYWILSSGSA